MPDRLSDQASDATPNFKDGSTSFGSFYPKHYLLAVLPTDATATAAVDALHAAGFSTDDVIMASGSDVVARAEVSHAGEGVLTRLQEQWSRFYTDGSAASQQLLDLANAGNAFVLAYAPEDAATTRAAKALRPFQPAVLRKFGELTVADLT